MSLELTDIKNFEDLDAITTISSDDILPITDTSEPADKKISVENLAKNLNVVGGGVYLDSGRKFAEEKRTDLGSSITGWVTVAETSYDVIVQACSGRCAIMTTNGYGVTVEYCLRPYSSGMTHENNTLKITGMCDTTAGFGTNIGGVRIAYAASDSAGIKLQVYVITEQILNVQISDNLGRLNAGTGLKLITATTTDIDKTPDGSTASYLEAGAEWSKANTYEHVPANITLYKRTDDVLRMSVDMGQIAKQNATNVSVTWGTNPDVFDPTGAGVDLSALTLSYGTLFVEDNLIYFQITDTVGGGFAGLLNNVQLTLRVQGMTITLS